MNNQVDIAEIVGQFLEQWCDQGVNLRTTERALFTKYRVFWAQATQRWIHEASYTAFRTELQRRGFRFERESRHYWYGLSLRKRPRGK